MKGSQKTVKLHAWTSSTQSKPAHQRCIYKFSSHDCRLRVLIWVRYMYHTSSTVTIHSTNVLVFFPVVVAQFATWKHVFSCFLVPNFILSIAARELPRLSLLIISIAQRWFLVSSFDLFFLIQISSRRYNHCTISIHKRIDHWDKGDSTNICEED